MTYRNSASFGKRQEYIAVAELLRRHFDVYMTLVDDQQIDCVLRQEKNGKLRYLDIQIKARSNDCRTANAGTFAAMDIKNPRENFFFVFYSEQSNTYWIMPSLVLVKEAHQNILGKNRGKYSIKFYNVTSQGVSPRPRFREYENAFHLLEWGLYEQVENREISKKYLEPIHSSVETESPKDLIAGHNTLQFLEALKKLEGLTLKTLEQQKMFRILHVTEKIVMIEAGPNKRLRRIGIKEIEPAYIALLGGRVLTLHDVRAWSEFNTAFVCAILAHLPGVGYKTGPIRLFPG